MQTLFSLSHLYQTAIQYYRPVRHSLMNHNVLDIYAFTLFTLEAEVIYGRTDRRAGVFSGGRAGGRAGERASGPAGRQADRQNRQTDKETF